MKFFSIALVGGLLLGAPAFADSVTIQTRDSAGVAVSPPVAAMPAPTEQRTIERDKVKQSDDGMKREEKRTQETVTPAGKSRSTTKTETDTDNDN
ncbi:MAG TPA: hypothetical protein VGF92_05180 [Stellaceae bacterium]|jgi:hypothetical protein